MHSTRGNKDIYLVPVFIILAAAKFGTETSGVESPSPFSDKYIAIDIDPFLPARDDDKDEHVYNETELVNTVAKISTKFKRFMMPRIHPRKFNLSSKLLIPTAVAKFNLYHRRDGDLPLELIIPYTHENDQLSTLIDKANEANKVFPGTVTLFVREDFGGLPKTARQEKAQIRELTQTKSELNSNAVFKYKLGATFGFAWCLSGKLNWWPSSLDVISQIDIILFQYELSHLEETHLRDFLQPTQNICELFDTCKTNLSKVIGNNGIEIAYKLKWPVVRMYGPDAPNGAHLAFLWKQMNEWAVGRNTTVVFVGDFASLVDDSTELETLPGMDNNITSLHNLEVNTTRGENHDNGGGDSTTPNSDSTSSHHHHVAVAFNPYLSKFKIPPPANLLSSLLQLVSKDFRQVSVDIWPSFNSPYTDMWKISSVVADMNKRSMLPEPLNVVLIFRCDEFRFGRMMSASVLANFGFVLNVADNANQIFPSTVQTLLIQYDAAENKQEGISDIVQHVKNARGKVDENPNGYEFGAVFNISECEEVVKPYLASVIRHVDTIVVTVIPSSRHFKSGVDHSLKEFLRQFNSCKENIFTMDTSWQDDVKVGLMVTWPDTDEDGFQNIANLVEFWEKVRNWNELTNTSVFINEAFDVPFEKASPSSTRGWWRLAGQSLTRNKASQVEFEDKKSLLLREKQMPTVQVKANKSTKSANIETPSDQGSYGLALLTLSIFLLVGIVFLYLKFAKCMSATRRLTAAEEEVEMNSIFLNNGDGGSLVAQAEPDNLTLVGENLGTHPELECSSDEFSIDKQLDSGEFGVVYQAKVRRNGLELDVAAKTSRVDTFSSIAVEQILAEIKILGYLGSHKNIVSIVGAYTAECSEGKIYIFTELCILGSLKKMLRKMNPTILTPTSEVPLAEDDVGYVDHSEFEEISDKVESQNGSARNVLDPADSSMLLKWAYEISCGMEFLASKRVVHADLATRNVLLTGEKTAKICDFGLSRRMYNYGTLVKTKTDSLPWRWMAPESLRHLEFDEKSDVWAYGVTLWEIFSCGQAPYPGILRPSADFVDELECGLKLERPRYDYKNLYEIMLKCWHLDKNLRPQFSDLKSHFEEREIRE